MNSKRYELKKNSRQFKLKKARNQYISNLSWLESVMIQIRNQYDLNKKWYKFKINLHSKWSKFDENQIQPNLSEFAFATSKCEFWHQYSKRLHTNDKTAQEFCSKFEKQIIYKKLWIYIS